MKVAVITPIYQCFSALDTLVSCNFKLQTHKNIELFLGDDCSVNVNEATEILKKYIGISGFNFFTLLDRKPWSLPDIYNIASYNTNADLIVMVDSDILFFPDHVEKHVLIHENRGPFLIEGDCKTIDWQDVIRLNEHPEIITEIKTLDLAQRSIHEYDDPFCCNQDDCNGRPMATRCTFLPHGASISKKIFDEIGGFRPEFSGQLASFDYDLAIRLEVINVKIKRSKLPKTVMIPDPSRHDAPRTADDAGYRIFSSFCQGLPGNYINTNKSNRNYKFIIRDGKLVE
jgi:hypothetical protein